MPTRNRLAPRILSSNTKDLFHLRMRCRLAYRSLNRSSRLLKKSEQKEESEGAEALFVDFSAREMTPVRQRGSGRGSAGGAER